MGGEGGQGDERGTNGGAISRRRDGWEKGGKDPSAGYLDSGD